MAVEVARRRFTVHEYEQMYGILGEDDRVELIDGEIIEMTPIGPVHAGVVNRLNRLLTKRVGQQAILGIQNPVRISLDTELQPDVTVLRPRSDDYTLSHPVPDDVLLLIEVADTSVGLDLGLKVPRYAEAGIVEVWVVDLVKKVIVTHVKPTESGYLHVETVELGRKLTPELLAGVQIDVKEILG